MCEDLTDAPFSINNEMITTTTEATTQTTITQTTVSETTIHRSTVSSTTLSSEITDKPELTTTIPSMLFIVIAISLFTVLKKKQI